MSKDEQSESRLDEIRTPIWQYNEWASSKTSATILFTKLGTTVLHEKRVDFEFFYILDHNFLLQWFWVLKLDTYALLYIPHLPLQSNAINHKDCDFMASQRQLIRKIL